MSRSEEHDARNAALLQAFSSRDDAKAAGQPTAKTIPAECQRLGLPWQSEDIAAAEGARLHWIGDRNAAAVLLYFHGGGFGLTAFPGHVIFLASCIEKAAAEGTKLLVAMVEYGLTPTTKYPTQYIQGIQALRQVISAGYPPSGIVIGGDSCGANLGLGMISSILHPHPSVPTLELSTPLRGLLLICPWVSFSADWPSYTENQDKDIHSGPSMEGWANDFASVDERNTYSEPCRTQPDWWANAPVQKVLNVWGEHELFRDSIRDFNKTLSNAGLDVKAVECALQVHIDCILDAQTAMQPGLMSSAVWEWLEVLYR